MVTGLGVCSATQLFSNGNRGEGSSAGAAGAAAEILDGLSDIGC